MCSSVRPLAYLESVRQWSRNLFIVTWTWLLFREDIDSSSRVLPEPHPAMVLENHLELFSYPSILEAILPRIYPPFECSHCILAGKTIALKTWCVLPLLYLLLACWVPRLLQSHSMYALIFSTPFSIIALDREVQLENIVAPEFFQYFNSYSGLLVGFEQLLMGSLDLLLVWISQDFWSRSTAHI